MNNTKKRKTLAVDEDFIIGVGESPLREIPVNVSTFILILLKIFNMHLGSLQ